MRGARTLLGWWLAHPRVADSAVAVVAGVVAVWGPAAGDRSPRSGLGPSPDNAVLDGWGVLLICVGVVVLCWRRDRPLWVWAVVTAIAAVTIIRAGHPTAVIALPLLGLYTIGTRAPLTRTALTVVVTAAVLSAAGSADGAELVPALSMLAFSAAAGAAGAAVRGYRTTLDSADARARLAEQSRADEAVRAVTAERLRIARELHDIVAHHISVINVQAGVARHLMTVQPEVADAALAQVRQSSRTVLTEMSTMLGLLRTDEDSQPTQPTPTLTGIPELLATMDMAGLDVTHQIRGGVRQLDEVQELTAYRIVQESLTNALKHGTGTAELTLTYDPEGLTITVGNPMTGLRQVVASGGHGLVGMRERVSTVGGRLTAGPDPQGRFVVQARIGRESQG